MRITRGRLITYGLIEQDLRDHPMSSTKAIAHRVGRSPGTVRQYLAQMRTEQRLIQQVQFVSQFGYKWLYTLIDPKNFSAQFCPDFPKCAGCEWYTSCDSCGAPVCMYEAKRSPDLDILCKQCAPGMGTLSEIGDE